MGWLRALGRRFGIGERRWMPDPEERDRHRREVRGRLRDDVAAHEETGADGAPAPDDDSLAEGAPERDAGVPTP
jgi:hypothetical protein